MKLSDFSIGVMVIDHDMNVGDVVGVTYNCRVQEVDQMSSKERLERATILVDFVDGRRGVHRSNLRKCKAK
jgi:hypothetical protein